MSANFGGGGNSQEVDLNITPIIDCFTVLITFMLASASFLSIGFLEASTPGNSADPQASEPNTEAILRLKGDHRAEFKIKGKLSYQLSFDLSNKEGVARLDQEFQKLHESLKDTRIQLSQVLLTAEDAVEYQAIAEVMDHLNQSELPVVVGDFQ